MSTVPVSLDPPDTTGALGYPASAAQGPWRRGSATSELDAGPAATDVAPPQSSTPPLSTPWSWSWPGPGDGSVWLADGAAMRRIVGDRDHRYPRRTRDAPPRGRRRRVRVEHNDADHNPARNGDAERVVPAEDRPREYRLWASGECRQGEQQQLPAVGDWYAGCTD
jgi:hypothetical protein